MTLSIASWEFIFELTDEVRFKQIPKIEGIEFHTDNGNTSKTFSIRIPNSKNFDLTEKQAEGKANKIAVMIIHLFVVVYGHAIKFSNPAVYRYDSKGKEINIGVTFSITLNIKNTSACINIPDQALKELISNNYDLLTLIQFTSYAIRSQEHNPMGSILSAYLAAQENFGLFERHDIKKIRYLRNALAHTKDINQHKMNLQKFESANSCHFQRNGHDFLDLSAPRNIELLDNYALKMIRALRQFIKKEHNIEYIPDCTREVIHN